MNIYKYYINTMNHNSHNKLSIMDNTILFYDKFALIHNYTNSLTSSITIDELINSDITPLLNIDAITEFNKFGNHHYITPDLNFNLYTIYMYVLDKDRIFTLVGINNELLYELIDTNQPIPNFYFMIIVISPFKNFFFPIWTIKTI